VKLNAFLNLLFDGLLWPTIRRVESIITAKSTPSRADFSIAVGTTETRINADFLHAPAKLLFEVVAVTVETPVVTPRIGHGLE
jgi:hypothetical protein